MEVDIYSVIGGDTLSKIAQRHGVDVDELARINHIREPNFIHVGQKIKIPRKTAEHREEDQFYSELWIRFTDAIGQPIKDLKARVVTALGEFQFVTDDVGLLPPVRTQNKDDRPEIHVAKLEGGDKKVATIKAPSGTHQYTLRSRSKKSSRRFVGTMVCLI